MPGLIICSEERIKEYTEKGWWGTVTVDELFRRHAGSTPHAIAVMDPANRLAICDGEPRRVTFAQLDDEVNRLAVQLIAHEIGKDDIVAIQLPNTIELVAAYLAIGRIGAIASPFPVQYRQYEYEQLLGFLGAKAMLTTTRIGERRNAEILAQFKATHPVLETILAWGENVPAGVVPLQERMAEPFDETLLTSYLENAVITANDILTICWTSGTEGRPKGVPRSHNEWFISAYATVDVAELTQSDILLNPFPMVNMAGIGGMLVPWVLTGCTLIQHHPFDLPVFLRQIAEEKVTYTVAPPALLNMLLQNDNILANSDISSIRVIGSGSAPLSPWMVKTWKESFGVEIINIFGSNEGASFIGGAKEIDDPELRAKYLPRFGVGGYEWSARVAQRMQSRLVDVQTGEIITEAGRPGELRLRGAGIFSGYWKQEDLTRKVFDEEGYFCTGDVFEIAGEGDNLCYYRVVGRAKDIIIRGGMNISPEEIESLVQGHAKVAEVAVVGYPDPILGERSCVCVVPRPAAEITLGELIEYLKQKNIASYKLPERLLVLEALPRNPVGKIVKQSLREMLSKEPV